MGRKNLLLRCAVCKYDIASVSKDTKNPLSGAMFLSKDIKHGFPPPWRPMTTHVDMFCPMCAKRAIPLPVETEDILGGIEMLTNEGVFFVEDEGIVFLNTEEDEIAAEFQFIDGEVFNEEDLQLGVQSEDGSLSESEQDTTEEDGSDLPEDATDAPVGSTDTSAPVDSPADGGGTTEPQTTPIERPQVISAETLFKVMLENGTITQKGSWFDYEGTNYRREDLLTKLENNLNG